MNGTIGDNYIDLRYVFGEIYTFVAQIIGPFLPPPEVWKIVKFILAGFSVFFIFIIVYCFIRILEIRKKEHEHLHHEIEHYRKKREEEEIQKEKKPEYRNEKWNIVLQYLFSASQSDWKLSVIEADNMLDVLMDQLGFKGDNLGEKLKSADRDKFKSLTSAWEAHTIRNRIAHEGADFQLSHHEAKRVIALYEQIFREFGYI